MRNTTFKFGNYTILNCSAQDAYKVYGVVKCMYLVLLVKYIFLFLVFTSHVIKTKNRNHSMNRVKNIGYDR